MILTIFLFKGQNIDYSIIESFKINILDILKNKYYLSYYFINWYLETVCTGPGPGCGGAWRQSG